MMQNIDAEFFGAHQKSLDVVTTNMGFAIVACLCGVLYMGG
jgi:hypothetical protein